MGYAIAQAAARRGAEVTLISGPVSLKQLPYVDTVYVESAQDMYEAVVARATDQDIIIKAAAVADYRPVEVAQDKIKKKEGEMAIPLARTQDIIGYLGQHRKPGPVPVRLSPWRTRDMVENSRKKLEKKNLDMWPPTTSRWRGPGSRWTPTS